MRILQRLLSSNRRQVDRQRNEEAEPNSQWIAEIGYQKLEARKVLSATFFFDEGLLALSGFDAGQDLSFSQSNSADGDAFVFEIENGDFVDSGSPEPQIDIGLGSLSVPTSLITEGIRIDGNNNIGLTQDFLGTQEFSVASLEVTNFELVDESLELDISGSLSLQDISVSDSDPNVSANLQLSAQASSIDVAGQISNLSTDRGSGISLIADGVDGDLITSGATVETAEGDIFLSASQQIILAEDGPAPSRIISGDDGEIFLTAGSIFMDDGSSIDGTNGDVFLTANGLDDAEVVLGRVETTDDININSAGEVLDGTGDELPNLNANRLDLTAESVGVNDDIDTQVDLIVFNTSQSVQISDVSAGVVIDAASSAGGGFLNTVGPLTISSDVTLTSSFSFVAEDSPSVGDTIRIENSSLVLLDAPDDQALEFIAGDDIVFDLGRIETTGGGLHSVRLTADNEGAADVERGSIFNATDASIAIATNNLEISSGDGIGQIGNGLRTSVDRLLAVNSFSNEVVLAESDGLIIEELSNAARSVTLFAGGFLDIQGPVIGDEVRLLAQGDVLQSSGSVITANRLGVFQDASLIDSSNDCLLYTSPSPRDRTRSRMPSSA